MCLVVSVPTPIPASVCAGGISRVVPAGVRGLLHSLLELLDLCVVVGPLGDDATSTGQLGLLGQRVVALHDKHNSVTCSEMS